jgi:hypothetical protein
MTALPLEKQVCSLDLAKRLKELGVKQWGSVLFYHDTRLKKVAWRGDIQTAPVDFGDRYIAAFTVAELGEMLPRTFESGSTIWPEAEKRWVCSYQSTDYDSVENDNPEWIEYAPTEADARAKTLVHLIENKLVTV